VVRVVKSEVTEAMAMRSDAIPSFGIMPSKTLEFITDESAKCHLGVENGTRNMPEKLPPAQPQRPGIESTKMAHLLCASGRVVRILGH
jgi:hypothetical protein